METSGRQDNHSSNSRDTTMDFSQVVFPSNEMKIGHLPQFADVAFANLIISFGGSIYNLFCKVVDSMQESDEELKGLSVEDTIWRNRNEDLSFELAGVCFFTYRSHKTHELYQGHLMPYSTAQPKLTNEEMDALKAKIISYGFRRSQHLGQIKATSFDHSPETWRCEEDARLLEILLDPEWRNVISFAIDPCDGSDRIDSPATTVWNTVIAVLFNNLDKYKPKTRFPNDVDFWHFDPNQDDIKHRAGDLLRERLMTLKSHFAELAKVWNMTGSLCLDLPKPATITFRQTSDGRKECQGRTQDVVVKLTTLYMFEIWSQDQDDEFTNRVFGIDAGDTNTANETYIQIGGTPSPDLGDSQTRNEDVDSVVCGSDSESFVFS